MPNTKQEQKLIALSYETISATIVSETLQQVLEILRLCEENADFPIQTVNSFRSIIEKAAENAKRDADASLLADCRAEQPEGLPLT